MFAYQIKSNQILFIYAETLRTVIAVAVFISAPQLLDNKRKKNYRYCIDVVVVDGLGRAGGLDRGEQGPLSFFNYDL